MCKSFCYTVPNLFIYLLIYIHCIMLKQWGKRWILHTYTHTHTHTYAHIYIHTYIHTHTHTYICTYMHTYLHSYTHTHTYIRTYIHTCRVGYARMNVIGSRTSFIIASVHSSIQWNIYIFRGNPFQAHSLQQNYHPTNCIDSWFSHTIFST